MPTLFQPRGHGLRAKLGDWRYRAGRRAKRFVRAWRYLRDRLSADEAQTVTLDCRDAAGWHPLLVLTVEDTLEQAREIYADHPELARLIAEGCARVGYKWESYGDELYEARRWAIDLAQGYADSDGITLTRIDEDDVEGDAEQQEQPAQE